MTDQIDARQILIVRQTAMKAAAGLVGSGYAQLDGQGPAEAIEELAEKLTAWCLNPDAINRWILAVDTVIDPPLPAPTPVSPVAAPSTVPPAQTSPSPEQAPHPAEQASQPTLVAQAQAAVSQYAGTKCPYHPAKSRKSTAGPNPSGDYCTGCEWGHYFFNEDDGSVSEKWRLSKSSGYFDAAGFDEAVAEAAAAA
jgi:hypothetical protein